MTTLDDALVDVAHQLELSPKQLIKYADEDQLPGYYDGGGQYAIPYAADGKFLYALIRALKPETVLEVGTAQGGSARHIAEALEANGNGRLITVDVDQNSTCEGIEYPVRRRITHNKFEAESWLKGYVSLSETFGGDLAGFDFIHEDGSHSAHLVHAIYGMLPQLMPRGGVIVSHDIGTGVASDIRRGIQNAGFELPPEYIYDGSPCGFTVMKYKGVRSNEQE